MFTARSSTTFTRMCPVFKKHGHVVKSDENRVIEATRLLMGARLSDFLLSGYGEAYGSYRRVFVATLRGDDGEIPYEFEMINHGELGLPAGRDPAVLAALLQLPVRKEASTDVISFKNDAIRGMLGWSDIPETHFVIGRAIEHYFSTAYYIVNTQLPRSELLCGRYSSYRQLIGSHETLTEQFSVKPIQNLISTTVKFPLNFISSLSTERKCFLDIDFETLLSLERLC